MSGADQQSQWLQRIMAGERRALAQAITLVESERPEDAPRALALMDALAKQTELQKCQAHAHSACRIGISGPPGVGKSSLIERLGLLLLGRGLRVAVLAIDPTSPIAGGSIMGDKVRMPSLAFSEGAYVRPSAARGLLGGIGLATPEAIMLCEAAGYDCVIVESVGVGQSEVSTALATDCFVLLSQPFAGDELQAIKRGILELSNVVVVNKADGDTLQAAEQAQQVLAQNLSFVRAQEVPEVLLTSAETGQGIEVLWHSIQQFLSHYTVEQLQSRRQQRYGQLWQQNVPTFLWQALSIDPERAQLLEQAQSKVMTGLCAPLSAARELYVNLFAPPKV